MSPVPFFRSIWGAGVSDGKILKDHEIGDILKMKGIFLFLRISVKI